MTNLLAWAQVIILTSLTPSITEQRHREKKVVENTLLYWLYSHTLLSHKDMFLKSAKVSNAMGSKAIFLRY